jgi:hypothetical protein
MFLLFDFGAGIDNCLELADIKSNAAQLREVQAKLQELLTKQAATKKQEPVKKPEKTTERKPAPAKKAGD